MQLHLCFKELSAKLKQVFFNFRQFPIAVGSFYRRLGSHKGKIKWIICNFKRFEYIFGRVKQFQIVPDSALATDISLRGRFGWAQVNIILVSNWLSSSLVRFAVSGSDHKLPERLSNSGQKSCCVKYQRWAPQGLRRTSTTHEPPGFDHRPHRLLSMGQVHQPDLYEICKDRLACIACWGLIVGPLFGPGTWMTRKAFPLLLQKESPVPRIPAS